MGPVTRGQGGSPKPAAASPRGLCCRLFFFSVARGAAVYESSARRRAPRCLRRTIIAVRFHLRSEPGLSQGAERARSVINVIIEVTVRADERERVRERRDVSLAGLLRVGRCGAPRDARVKSESRVWRHLILVCERRTKFDHPEKTTTARRGFFQGKLFGSFRILWRATIQLWLVLSSSVEV